MYWLKKHVLRNCLEIFAYSHGSYANTTKIVRKYHQNRKQIPPKSYANTTKNIFVHAIEIKVKVQVREQDKGPGENENTSDHEADGENLWTPNKEFARLV